MQPGDNQTQTEQHAVHAEAAAAHQQQRPPQSAPQFVNPFGQGPPPFLRMSIHLSHPDPRDSEVELKDNYQPWEYFLAPTTQKELLHKYCVLKRTLFGQDPMVEDPESKNLLYWFGEFLTAVNDVRMWNVKNIDIKWRFYLSYGLALSPLFLFKKHKLRRCIPATVLTWYFMLPEFTKAIVRAK